MAQLVYSARMRPFVVPEHLDDLAGPKPDDGVVSLPMHLDWGHGRAYDLSKHADRRRLYEQVLREGSLEDLRRYIDVDQLIDLWDELYLPAHIKQAWAYRLNEQRGLQLGC